MSGDSRKDFVLATTANHFAVPINDGSMKNLQDSAALNSFLDDGNASVLAGRFDPKSRIKLLTYSNKVLICALISCAIHVRFITEPQKFCWFKTCRTSVSISLAFFIIDQEIKILE